VSGGLNRFITPRFEKMGEKGLERCRQTMAKKEPKRILKL
jgi:hypothetical protein